jgi:hypothetical protein
MTNSIKHPVSFNLPSNLKENKSEEEYTKIKELIKNERISKNYGIFYIYVIENDSGNIKIGITHNFEQRKKNLSGSNTGGHKITKYYVSEPTYLYSFEGILHSFYKEHRIDGTEWFKDLDFDEVVLELQKLFNHSSYNKLNTTRMEHNIQHYKSILEKEREER